MINVTIYNEFIHETEHENVRAIYPTGIHGCIKEFLEKEPDIKVIQCATLADHKETLTQKVLDETDVLIWWAHIAHHKVDDKVVDMVCQRVIEGMGFIALHSAHASKPFKRLLGTNTEKLRWREAGEKVRLWTVARSHAITQGLPNTWVVPHDETYGEPWGIPEPDRTIFLSWYQGGEVFRSGACWLRGEGKIFYLQNGHETFPIYHQPEIQLVIKNAVRWACPCKRSYALTDEARGMPGDALEEYDAAANAASFTPVTKGLKID